MNVNQNVASLIAKYGDGSDGMAPTAMQWKRILERDPNAPFALINFFKFREQAVYLTEETTKITGNEAFERYAEVSIPSMQSAGGEFVSVSPYAGSFLGVSEDWDLIAIGKYPNLESFLALYQNEAYVEAFAHRKAAVHNQSVLVMDA